MLFSLVRFSGINEESQRNQFVFPLHISILPTLACARRLICQSYLWWFSPSDHSCNAGVLHAITPRIIFFQANAADVLPDPCRALGGPSSLESFTHAGYLRWTLANYEQHGCAVEWAYPEVKLKRNRKKRGVTSWYRVDNRSVRSTMLHCPNRLGNQLADSRESTNSPLARQPIIKKVSFFSPNSVYRTSYFAQCYFHNCVLVFSPLIRRAKFLDKRASASRNKGCFSNGFLWSSTQREAKTPMVGTGRAGEEMGDQLKPTDTSLAPQLPYENSTRISPFPLSRYWLHNTTSKTTSSRGGTSNVWYGEKISFSNHLRLCTWRNSTPHIEIFRLVSTIFDGEWDWWIHPPLPWN